MSTANDLSFMASASQSGEHTLEFLLFGAGGKVLAKKVGGGYQLPCTKKLAEWDLATCGPQALQSFLAVNPGKMVPFYGQTKGANYRLTFLVQGIDKEIPMNGTLVSLHGEKLFAVDFADLCIPQENTPGLVDYYRALIRNITAQLFPQLY